MPTRTIMRGLVGLPLSGAMLTSLMTGLGGSGPVPHTASAPSPGTLTLSAGVDAHSCAIETAGVYCWGGNSNGQLGDGASVAHFGVPVAVDTSGVLAGKTIIKVAEGQEETCALDSTRKAYCWGNNVQSGLGDGHRGGASNVPVTVDTRGVLAGKTLTQITVGDQSACALDNAGSAYCWGWNEWGQLGNGTTTESDVPVAVDTGGVLAGKNLTQISAGNRDVCALDSTGAAYCWGQGSAGKLGDGNTHGTTVPVAVDTHGVLAGKTLTQITVGSGSACALSSAGAAYCWGAGGVGNLGDGATANSSVPVAVDTHGVLAGKTVTQVTTSGNTACALDTHGKGYCWGNGSSGALGDNSTADTDVPVAVDTSGALAGKTLIQITANGSHACAVETAGAMYCWGANGAGELGDNAPGIGQTRMPVLTGPHAPANVKTVPGDTAATISWSAPANLDGGTLDGYTATASPGGKACRTTGGTTCTITGLANGTTYRVTVVAETTAGDSGASTPASGTPIPAHHGPAFTSRPAATAPFGKTFTFTVTTTGNPAPAITRTGQLPPGVRFTARGDGSAAIAGIPDRSAAGVYPLTLTARNSNGAATQAFTLTVTRAPAIRKIRPIRIPVGASLHRTIRANGYPAPRLTESRPLPHGLSFTGNRNGSAVIAGTPAPGSSGRYRVTITATNASGKATRYLTIIIFRCRHR